MNALQPLPPRRSSLSPKTTARNGVSRTVFALPVIHQFEPVLASSPKSYMAKSAKKAMGGDTTRPSIDQEHADGQGRGAATAAVGSPPIAPSQPHRPKSREAVESPRVVRPQPPAGISSRADVDIYRYSQGTEQRMAIRPLFEQRRESEAEVVRPPSTKKKGKRGAKRRETELEEDIVDQTDDHAPFSQEGGRQGAGSRHDANRGEEDGGNEKKEGQVDPRVQTKRFSNQAFHDGRSSHGEVEQAVSINVLDMESTQHPESQANDNLNAAKTLVKPLNLSTCHEPFMLTEGPKLSWLRYALENVSPNPAMTSNRPRDRQSPAKSDMLVYKVLGKHLREFGERNVFVTVVLSSRGDAHIACKVSGHTCPEDENVIAITEADLAQSKLIRPDLQVLTPKWADWIITRVCCDSRSVFFVDYVDTEGNEKRRCFSEILQTNGKEVAVEMFALTTANSLLISVRDAASDLNYGEVLLRSDELRRLAVSLEKWPAESDETQAVPELFNDHDFLLQLATKTNVIRLGMNCERFDENLMISTGRGATPPESTSDFLANEISLAGLELVGSASFVRPLIDENKQVGAVALLAQAYVENGMLSALRKFQQQEAVQLNVAAFMQQATTIDSESAFNDRVEQKLKTARMAKLQEIAIASIVDDMILDFITFECRVEIHGAKHSGGYDDHYASKVQAAYRMSAQKKSYEHKRHVRMRAAQMLQALQRGIIARRRYCEMKVEREKYLFYGFRSSLYHATANMKDPRLQAQELSKEAERRRHAFFMQVMQGYVAEHFVDDDFRVSLDLVRDICTEYSVVVGCSANFGDVVASYLGKAPDPALYASVGDSARATDAVTPPRLHSNSQVSAALLLGLRDQYDGTFGLSSSARRLGTGSLLESRKRRLESGDSSPPRWMLKTCAAFQQSNRNRLAGLRLTCKAAGRKAAHLVARDYHNVLSSSFNSFDGCRSTWEAEICVRHDQQRRLDTFSVDELVQHCLDLLISCVKDWGIDPTPLFEALNLCGCHCHGKAAVRIVEMKFNKYAAKMNEVHGKQSVLTLREEISQELEDFEKLLALRCLNMALDDAVTVPTSELLHIMLKGNVDEEYLRHGLSVVLPIASITEKHDLARKMLHAYANAAFGDALNLICWSCLDVAENVTVEAARFLDKITRPLTESEDIEGFAMSAAAFNSEMAKQSEKKTSESLTARALYLLTGSQAVRFLQFLAKVAHFNKAIQKRVLAHLAPYAAKFEMHRLASTVCALEDFGVVSRLFDEHFSIATLQSCEPVWTQYNTLFGAELTALAMASSNLQPDSQTTDT